MLGMHDHGYFMSPLACGHQNPSPATSGRASTKKHALAKSYQMLSRFMPPTVRGRRGSSRSWQPSS